MKSLESLPALGFKRHSEWVHQANLMDHQTVIAAEITGIIGTIEGTETEIRCELTAKDIGVFTGICDAMQFPVMLFLLPQFKGIPVECVIDNSREEQCLRVLGINNQSARTSGPLLSACLNEMVQMSTPALKALGAAPKIDECMFSHDPRKVSLEASFNSQTEELPFDRRHWESEQDKWWSENREEHCRADDEAREGPISDPLTD